MTEGGDRSDADASGGRPTWLLYGAYGYTGRLLAAEALRRGHRPILAGRDEVRLEALAHELVSRELGDGTDPSPLPQRAFPLDDTDALEDGLDGVSAVLHAAGPFVETAEPMMQACLAVGAHYLDITGEVPVFERAFELDGRARERGIVLIPGVGMDVIPTDGAAALLAEALPSGVRLELALHSPGSPSGGTLETIVEGIPGGLLVRRGGKLQRASPIRREFRRWVDLGPEPRQGPMAGKLGGKRSVAPYTWGDLATAWRTTGIGDITCYTTTPRSQVLLLPFVLPILRGLFSVGPVRRFVRSRVARKVDGPSAARRRTGRSRVWGRVEDEAGRAAEAVLEFPEGYRFTALGGVRAVEELLDRSASEPRESLAGTRTPAGTFGARWVLELPGVEVVRAPGPVGTPHPSSG